MVVITHRLAILPHQITGTATDNTTKWNRIAGKIKYPILRNGAVDVRNIRA